MVGFAYLTALAMEAGANCSGVAVALWSDYHGIVIKRYVQYGKRS